MWPNPPRSAADYGPFIRPTRCDIRSPCCVLIRIGGRPRKGRREAGFSLSPLRSRIEPCQVFQILLALLGPAVVARLVFGAHQGIGPAAFVGRQIEVAPRPGDRPLT